MFDSKRATCPICRAVFRRSYEICPRDGVNLEPLPRDPLVGTLIGERYQVEEVIADGFHGRHYQARRQDRTVAIEVMYGDLAMDQERVRRFLAEASLVRELDHPNLVPVVDAGKTPAGVPFLVRELMGGRTLDALLEQQGPLSRARAARITADLCRGLGHLHRSGLVYRALHGSRVYLEERHGGEVARITDFSRALPAGTQPEPARPEKIHGSPAYLAPEQALGAPLDTRSDFFSLGVLLYRMISGSLPFAGPPIALVLQNVYDAPPPIPTPALDADGTDQLETVARRLMAKSPEQRPDSAEEVLLMLDVAE